MASDSARVHWPLGRITKIFPDPDQIVRTVEILSQGHHSLRTLEKLYPLETTSAELDSNVAPIDDEPATFDPDKGTPGIVSDLDLSDARPRRAAAIAGEAARLVHQAADQL